MITGFNTDVQYEGRVFHVQTEDRGLDNPVVESLVYTGGEIITSRRTAYADLARSADYTEAEVARRMESQHQALIREILSGRFDPEGPKPFGYNIITNRSFDAVVREFLTHDAGVESIRLELDGHPALLQGSRQVLSLRVVEDASGAPVAGANVFVKLLTTADKPKELFHGVTGGDGIVAADIVIPETPNANSAILCQAEKDSRNAEIKQLVLKSSPSPS